MCVSSRKLGRTFLKGPKQPLRLCPHCTSTSRNVTSLMTARFGTKRRTKGIVTNHGMPVRWSTAHYRFSRAPCTATLYRPPSLTRSSVSFSLSLSPSASLPSTDDFPVSLSLSLPPYHSFSLPPAIVSPLSLFHYHSLSSFERSPSLSRAYTLPRCGVPLRADEERALLFLLVFHAASPSPKR